MGVYSNAEIPIAGFTFLPSSALIFSFLPLSFSFLFFSFLFFSSLSFPFLSSLVLFFSFPFLIFPFFSFLEPDPILAPGSIPVHDPFPLLDLITVLYFI